MESPGRRESREAETLVELSRRLGRSVEALGFQPPVHTVYNPLVYARACHEAYLEKYGHGKKEVVLVGMNPGPFGMTQTGVPFGDVTMVTGFLGLTARIDKPPREHPRRPVLGFECPRSEVSGTRLWGWARQRYGSANRFFSRFFVLNYCPLCFMEESGRNLTPDKLPKAEQRELFSHCDRALAGAIRVLQPSFCIGVGAFATKRIRQIPNPAAMRVGTILHPSPASPKANRGWGEAAEADFRAIGVHL